MTRTEAILASTARIDHMYADWNENGGVSPDDHDCILICDKALQQVPGYEGSTDEGRRFLADELYDRQCGDDQLIGGMEIAHWIIDRLMPKPFANGVRLGGAHE